MPATTCLRDRLPEDQQLAGELNSTGSKPQQVEAGIDALAEGIGEIPRHPPSGGLAASRCEGADAASRGIEYLEIERAVSRRGDVEAGDGAGRIRSGRIDPWPRRCWFSDPEALENVEPQHVSADRETGRIGVGLVEPDHTEEIIRPGNQVHVEYVARIRGRGIPSCE